MVCQVKTQAVLSMKKKSKPKPISGATVLQRMTLDTSDEDDDDKWCLKHGTPALGSGGTSNLGNKSYHPKKRIQKNKCRLNVEDKRYHPTTNQTPMSHTCLISTTNALVLLTETERRRLSVQNCQKPKLTNEQRLYLISFLQQHQEDRDGNLKRGSIPLAAKIFHVSTRRTLYFLWNQYLKTCDEQLKGTLLTVEGKENMQ